MTKIKILHYIETLDAGGIEISLLDLYRCARNSPLDMIVFSSGGMLEKDYLQAHPTNYVRYQRRFPIDLRVIYFLCRIVKRRGIKIIHVHNPVAAVHAYLVSLITKSKVVFTHHNYHNLDDYKNKLARFLLMRLVNANVYVSKDLMRDYISRYYLPKKNIVISSRIDYKRLKISYLGDLRKELGLSKDSVLFGSIGSFGEGVRNQITTCRIIPQIIGKVPKIHFVFVGGLLRDGDWAYYNRCYQYCARKKVLKNVHFLGIRRDIPQILNNLSAFIHSSRWDTQSIATLEALGIGLPVVLSDTPSLREFYNNCTGVTFFKTGDQRDLLTKLHGVLSKIESDQITDHQINQTKQWVKHNFNINIYIKELKQLYKSLI